MSGYSGAIYERPITSERAHMLRRCYGDAPDVRDLLARGETTLRAVAVAYYGGDMARARADLYPPPARPRRGA